MERSRLVEGTKVGKGASTIGSNYGTFTQDTKVHDLSSSSQLSVGSRLGSAMTSETRLSDHEGQSKGATAVGLHQAARSGDVETVRIKLQAPDIPKVIDALDRNGMSALHYAARFNHHEIVVLLVGEGKANASVGDEDQATPLHYAARKKQQDADNFQDLDLSAPDIKNTMSIIKYLVLHCDVNVQDSYGASPLHFAAMRGNVVAAVALLESPKILVNLKDHLDITPLHNAAIYNKVQLAELLIKNGALLNCADKDKCTALHQACIQGFHQMAQLLLLSCGDKMKSQELVAARDNDDNQAIHYAVESRTTKLVKLLFDHGAAVNDCCRLRSTASTPLHLAAVSGDTEMAEFLISHGARVDARDRSKATPLHRAAEFQNEAVTKALLDHVGTTVDPLDMDDYTPLLWAVCYKSTAIVNLLLAENADITAAEKDEKNVFHLAAENEQEEIIKILVQKVRGTPNKKLINEEDRYGNSPVHVAAENGNWEITQLLLDNGADIEDKNEDEESPFLLAAKTGNLSVCRELLRRSGTVVNDENEYSNTALHLSCEAGYLQIVELLCKHGADKDARNARSQTPLDLAAANGRENVIFYLLGEDVPIDPVDKSQVTPLRLAAKNGHASVVSSLIQRGADVEALDEDRNNCLDTAIDSGHSKVALAIMESAVWYKALFNEHQYEDGMPRETPLRKLIRKMPDVASVALTRCVHTGPDDVTFLDEQFYIDFHYHFLDDTYTSFQSPDWDTFKFLLRNSEEVVVSDTRSPYTTDLVWTKQNHPLTIMAERKRETLMGHPLVLAVIRQKWSVAKIFYYLFLAFYACFVAMLTAYMLVAEPPFDEDELESCKEGLEDWVPTNFLDVAKWIIGALAIIGILLEGVQFAGTRWLYLMNVANLVDWFTYIAAILIVIDFTECGLRDTWQWELGAFTVLAVWMSFLLYCRRLPTIGIYVVMITNIFYTFAEFFTIFFLFILAFAFSFYVLLQNQDPFETPFYATVKTWVMLLGELDYGGIFHAENPTDDPDWDGGLYFPVMTYIIFIIFLVVMAIILSNLLVGLAVDDVGTLRERAKVVKLEMQISLALDVELALPNWMRTSLKCNKRKERYYPNQDVGRLSGLRRALKKLTDGPLLSMTTIVHSVKELQTEEVPDAVGLQKQIRQNQTELRALSSKMDTIQRLLMEALNKLDAKPKAPPSEKAKA